MFGISGEHILVLGIILLIFGPRRLPELGNTLGKAIRNFKDSIGGVEEAAFKRMDREPTPTQNAAPTTLAEPAAQISEVNSDQIPLPLTLEPNAAKSTQSDTAHHV